SAYAVLTRWEQRTFAATLQPFLVVGTTSAVIVKAVFDHSAWPQLAAPTWIGIAAVLVAGLVSGDWLSKKIESSPARIAMIVLALGGGTATLVKGLVHLS
ncbi:MAG: sulfite exporter TauE/SafE family protein, partial [Brevibacterium sp.]|nr:sulfite exporter TauE/SafE family protein [Brevibacterium sp.]